MARAPLVQRFADYAVALRYDDISAEAVAIAKTIVFDTLGTGLGGYQRLLGQKAVAFAAAQLPGDEATLLGDGRRVSAQGAAFANGTMMKILGMDDSHRQAGHIAAQVVPAALAVAEGRSVLGRRLIEAIVAAYDLAVRVGSIVRQPQRERGLDLKGTVGVLAATVAAGLVAGLDAERLAQAIALAADMASGTEQYVYDPGPCETKDLIAGMAARNAVFAVQLAQAGFFGPRYALDGEYGFFRAFGGGDFDATEFDDLGQRFGIVGTAFKPHGGCRHTHQAVDAVQDLLSRTPINPADIDRVLIRTYRYALEPSFRVDADPRSRDTAGLSIRVATAVALTQGAVWPDDLLAHWDAPEVRRLRHVTDVEVDPEVEAVYPNRNGGTVVVTLRDGTARTGSVPYAKGEPESPMTPGEFRAKFDALSRAVLPAEARDTLYGQCQALEAVADVGALVGLTAAREAVTA